MSARAIAPDVGAARFERVGRPDQSRSIAGRGRGLHRLELERRIGEVGVDELIDELEVVAGDLQEVVERRLVEGRKGHVPTSAVAMPDTAYTSTGRLKPFNCRSPAAAAAIASSAAA